jgi:S-adenosylmethionine:tRNA-ribosyltransferase-isomerase (queuine synthetase)
MKPTLQQTQILKKYLRSTLDYRETYQEIYDHILSAVEGNTAGASFEEVVNNIINTDFGGAKGLVRLERQYYKSVVREVISQQWRYFLH